MLSLAVAGTVSAQLPKWTIHPTCDTLQMKIDNELLQSYSSGETTLWTMDGRQLFTTNNIILPFRDGVAAVVEQNTPFILGFVDCTGGYTSLPRVGVTYRNPYFANGYLLANVKGKFIFFDKSGNETHFANADKLYPFHKGFAAYSRYENAEKKKGWHYGYYNAEGVEVTFSILDTNGKRKPLDAKEIDFLSGIGENGKGVAAVRNKLYWFDSTSMDLVPLTWGDGEIATKQHLTINGNYQSLFVNPPEDGISINARYGKDLPAQLNFDGGLFPKLFIFADGELEFTEESASPYDYQTSLSAYGEDNELYGLALDSKKILPPQFEAVGLEYGNRAFVKTNGHWGVIEIMPEKNYTLRINKNEDVAFRHQKYETKIRLDLPSEISTINAMIDIPEETGCVIDKTSRESKNTASGNFVTYDCTLNIPATLPDTISSITYAPVSVTYDGIKLFDTPISIRAWHLRHHNVDLIESETSILNGVGTFTFDIDAQKIAGEKDFPFEVRIDADSVSVEFEKISETRYKCFVANLNEGINDINIYVGEKGCPSTLFPFEILYTRPVAKKKKSEGLVIRKKNRFGTYSQ